MEIEGVYRGPQTDGSGDVNIAAAVVAVHIHVAVDLGDEPADSAAEDDVGSEPFDSAG